jgi:hypothetical protein
MNQNFNEPKTLAEIRRRGQRTTFVMAGFGLAGLIAVIALANAAETSVPGHLWLAAICTPAVGFFFFRAASEPWCPIPMGQYAATRTVALAKEWPEVRAYLAKVVAMNRPATDDDYARLCTIADQAWIRRAATDPGSLAPEAGGVAS